MPHSRPSLLAVLDLPGDCKTAANSPPDRSRHASRGQAIPRPEVPDAVGAPSAEEVVLKVQASGSPIYTYQAGTDGQPGWTLKASEAELRDQRGGRAI
jgi:hypothetical protein